MPLTGTFLRSVDEKQRITIPKDLRAVLADGKDEVFYVAPGTDGSLSIYDEAAFVRLADRLASAPPAERKVRAFGRLFYAQAHRVQIDKQGRLRVPTQLAELAGVEREAILVGVGDHMELWNSVKWEAYTTQEKDNYDALAEAAFNYSTNYSTARSPHDSAVRD